MAQLQIDAGEARAKSLSWFLFALSERQGSWGKRECCLILPELANFCDRRPRKQDRHHQPERDVDTL